MWILLAILFLALLWPGGQTIYWRRVTAEELDAERRSGLLAAGAVLGAAGLVVLALVAPTWLWGLTWQGAALWFGLAHWYQVTVAWYSTLAVLLVLVLAWAMLAVLEKRNEGR